MDNDNENQNLSPRVNSKWLPDFVGNHVRLPCKIGTVGSNSDRVTVTASDQGEVSIQLNPTLQQKLQEEVDPFVEIVGLVQTPTTIQALVIINLGKDLDMKLVNDTIELIHDPRFYPKIFS